MYFEESFKMECLLFIIRITLSNTTDTFTAYLLSYYLIHSCTQTYWFLYLQLHTENACRICLHSFSSEECVLILMNWLF